MEKMAAAVGRNVPPKPGLAPDDDLPPEYWQALLDDPRADAKQVPSGGTLRLSQIPQHLLRVTCRRCARVVEIQKADATRLCGPDARWRDVGQRLLDNTCTRRTGCHEEDGWRRSSSRRRSLNWMAAMALKPHPTPLSGGDRKALAKELDKARAMTTILAAQSAEARAKGVNGTWVR
jgi:hypothetical protein